MRSTVIDDAVVSRRRVEGVNEPGTHAPVPLAPGFRPAGIKIAVNEIKAGGRCGFDC
jgi:hypothetical protein